MAENRKIIDYRWLLADIPCGIAISGNEEAVLTDPALNRWNFPEQSSV